MPISRDVLQCDVADVGGRDIGDGPAADARTIQRHIGRGCVERLAGERRDILTNAFQGIGKARGIDGDYLESRTRAILVLPVDRSEEHTSELQSLIRISYAVFCLKKKT